jgi:hypothetical protein
MVDKMNFNKEESILETNQFCLESLYVHCGLDSNKRRTIRNVCRGPPPPIFSLTLRYSIDIEEEEFNTSQKCDNRSSIGRFAISKGIISEMMKCTANWC